MADVDVAKVLEEAADLIQTRGLCKRTHENEHGALCLMGAIRTAAWGTSRISTSILAEDNRMELYSAATGAVQARVAEFGFSNPANWNDKPERTQADVVDMLQRAAKDIYNQADPQ